MRLHPQLLQLRDSLKWFTNALPKSASGFQVSSKQEAMMAAGSQDFWPIGEMQLAKKVLGNVQISYDALRREICSNR